MPKVASASPADDGTPFLKLLRMAAELVSTVSPYAMGCRLEIDVADGARILTNVFHVPLEVTADDSLEARILDVFARHKVGEWVPAKVIAGWLGDQKESSGHFKRTLAAMVKAGLLESNRTLGYRRALPPEA